MIQVTPSAVTTRQCQPPQGSRSIRAGMSVVRRFEGGTVGALMDSLSGRRFDQLGRAGPFRLTSARISTKNDATGPPASLIRVRDRR